MKKYHKRADGVWQANVTIGFDEKGKPIKKYFYSKDPKELDKKVREAKWNSDQGLNLIDDPTFGELVIKWKAGKAMTSEANQKCYDSIYRTHLEVLSQHKVKDLLPQDLTDIINKMAAAGSSERTMKLTRTVAAQIMDIALVNKLISWNPFTPKIVKVPKVQKQPRKPLNDTQMKAVTSLFAHKMAIGALVMLYCGLRRGELIALLWNDFDLTNKTVSITKSMYYSGNKGVIKLPKSKAGYRVVPVPDLLIPMLTAAKKAANSTVFICDTNGDYLSLEQFRRLWDGYNRYLNLSCGGKDRSRSKPKIIALELFTPHQLRHTYATMLYSAGTDVMTAKELLGHEDIETTMSIYTHLSDEKKEKSIDAFNSYLTSKYGVKKQGKM